MWKHSSKLVRVALLAGVARAAEAQDAPEGGGAGGGVARALTEVRDAGASTGFGLMNALAPPFGAERDADRLYALSVAAAAVALVVGALLLRVFGPRALGSACTASRRSCTVASSSGGACYLFLAGLVLGGLPRASGFAPFTSVQLSDAVDDWCDDPTAAVVSYGHISGWDTSRVGSFGSLFFQEKDFNDDISAWDTSSVTDMYMTFRDAEDFNAAIGGWDTSKVSKFSRTFQDTINFNAAIGGWDTASATTFSNIFDEAPFNNYIGGWDTSKVTSMDYTFVDAHAFNGDISAWDTSRVTSMSWTFHGADNFNAAIGGWDTSKVSVFTRMFQEDIAFNAAIGGWDTAKATTMAFMFRGGGTSNSMKTNFNQDIGKWNTANVYNMMHMFQYSKFTQASVAAWDVAKVSTGSSGSTKMFDNSGINSNCEKYWISTARRSTRGATRRVGGSSRRRRLTGTGAGRMGRAGAGAATRAR